MVDGYLFVSLHTTGHFSFVETQTKATAPLAVSSLPTLAKMSSSMIDLSRFIEILSVFDS